MKSYRFWGSIVLLIVATFLIQALPHGEDTPLQQPLTSIPLRIDGWQGEEIDLKPDIVAMAGVSSYINRTYWNADNRFLQLYVGYYENQRTGDSIHSPKNCLPSGGWMPIHASTITFSAPDRKSVTANYYVVANGGERQVVIYWYQSHGKIIASEYTARIQMVLNALRSNRTDAALVRITEPIQLDETQARKNCVRFAQQLLPKLDKILPR